MSDRTARIVGVAGIVFVVLLLVGVFSTGSMPKVDDPVDKIQSFMVHHRSGLLASNTLTLIGIPLALWFGVGLRQITRSDDPVTNAIGTFSLGGLLITAPMAMAGGAVSSSVVFVNGVADKLNGDTIRLAWSAQTLLFTATSAGIVAFALGAALAIRRSGALPAYTMWLALLAVLGNFLTMFSSLGSGAAALGLAGVLTFALFILVSGIAMAAGQTNLAST